MKNRSKAELKALENAPYLTHKDGYTYDITDKVQGVDYEINSKSLVTTDKREITMIKNARKNFIPFNEMDKEQAKEIRQKGQSAMMQQKRERKNLVDICNTILSLDAEDIAEHVVQPHIAEKLKGTGLTLYDLMVAKMAEEAIHGNVKAFQTVRDSAGDAPINKSEIQAEVVTDADMELVKNLSARLDNMCK